MSRQTDKRQLVLQGRTQVNLFFEASTRTQSSFEIAGKRLGADVMNMAVANSAVSKGETLLDTAKELGKPPAEVALRWVMDQPFMTSAIVGARNVEQLGETLKAGGTAADAGALVRLSMGTAGKSAYDPVATDRGFYFAQSGGQGIQIGVPRV